MVDNVTLPGTGEVIASDDVGGVQYQRIKLMGGASDAAVRLDVSEDQASGTGQTGILAMATRQATPANTSDADGDYESLQVNGGKLWVSGTYPEDTASANGDPIMVAGMRRTATPADQSGTDGDYEPLQGSAGRLWVAPLGFPVSISVDVTRPADTLAYVANDAISNSTTAPTSGGFTFANIARRSGGSVLITDIIVTSSNDPATMLQLELYIFNQAVTNVNDNVAFTVTDAEIKTCVARVGFALEDVGSNGFQHVSNLNILATCVGTADLRFLLRAKNAYTPASGEVITVSIKAIQLD